MKVSEYAKWQTHIHILTAEQAKDVLNKLRFFKLIDAVEVKEQASFPGEDWLLDGIEGALIKHHLMSRTSRRRVYHSKLFKAYKRDAPAIRKQLDRLIPNDDAVRQSNARRTLAYIVGGSLIHWVQRHHTRMGDSAPFILGQVSRAIEALESSFPGYIEANLFHAVITGGKNAKNIRPHKGASLKRGRRAPRD